MHYDIFDKYNLSIDKLLDYGFILDNDYYILKRNIEDDIYILIKINEKEFIVDVYDNDDNLYLPFYQEKNYGTYVTKVRNKVDDIKKDILNTCFISTDYKSKILSYTYSKYKTKEEYPWDSYDYFTLKVNNKWYLLFMNIPYKSLGIDKKENIDVINIKLDSNMIDKLIDNKNYYPAYHMNKKYWITILLDNNIDFEVVKTLIDYSYEIVKNKSK